MTQAATKLARRIASQLAEVEGVVAVALGGSRARGEAQPDSDIDLGVYYRNGQKPSVEELHRLARELGYRHAGDHVTDFGGWGAWINGGAWLQVEGHPVDWLYRDLDRVFRTIEDCREGRTTVYYQPGHPHGFHTQIYMGEIYYCQPLHDPEGVLAALKKLTEPYPPRLKEVLIRNQLWEACFALDTCRKPASRGDTFYTTGCLFRCAACLVQALFALNERYTINEKGSVEAAGALPLSPDGFETTVRNALSHPGGRPEQLEASVARLETLLQAVESLCEA